MVRRIIINEPIWKDRSIGVDLEGLDSQSLVDISIEYKNKEGRKYYEPRHTIRVRDIVKRGYPVMGVRWKKRVTIIPIDDLQELEGERDQTELF